MAVGAGPATRPRTARTDTKTFGAWCPSTGIRTTGSRRVSLSTRVSMTPSRSTVTSAVAASKGMRTWKTAVSPGS